MSETLTMNETPADQPEFNADEQDSLAVAESLEGGEQPLLAGKFKDQQSLEKAYLELQQKLGEPRDEVQTTEDEGEPAEQEPDDEEVTEESDSDQLTEEQANQLFEMVGGENAYKSMINGAGQNLAQEEIQMYDNVMGSGNASSIYFAVQALASKYSDATGSDGQLLTGKGVTNQAQGYRSQQELVAAMADPRYDRDPAYRQEVMQKLENSDVQF
jgi:hypothetical protein